MYIKRTALLIIYWEISKNFYGSYFFNTQIDGCFQKRTVLFEKVLWYDKSIGPFKTCVSQEKEEGKLKKKLQNSDVGGGVGAKKMWCYSLKKQDFESDVLFEWPRWCWLILLYSLWVYLLMMLLAFYETNKPYIKVNINYLYQTRYLQNYSNMVCKESK